jgi:hypothetical protein
MFVFAGRGKKKPRKEKVVLAARLFTPGRLVNVSANKAV